MKPGSREFEDYVSAAKRRAGVDSDRQLSKRLGFALSSITEPRNGRRAPSRSTVLKLAELAGVPSDQALADLEIWRARRLEARARRTLERARTTLARVGAAAIIGAVVTLLPNEGRTNQQPPSEAVYYGKCHWPNPSNVRGFLEK